MPSLVAKRRPIELTKQVLRHDCTPAGWSGPSHRTATTG
jgi:hypothetical protein